jgi:hypothetical protein
MSCLICKADTCICNQNKVYKRYVSLTDHINKLLLYSQRHVLSTSDEKTWQTMYDQAKEEQRTTALLITFKPVHND